MAGGIEAWMGFKQSFKFVAGGVMALNLDTAVSAFTAERPLAEAIAELAGCRRGVQELAGPGGASPQLLRKAARLLGRIKIEFPGAGGTGRRRKLMQGLSERGADRTMFMNEAEGREMSVAEYFRATGRPLRMPTLPCANVGNRDKPQFIPVELCKIVRGQRRMKLNPQQTSEMITIAKQDPRDKAASCDRQAQQVEAALRGSSTAAHWGLQLNTQMTKVEGRVLPSPVLTYGGQQNLNVGGKGAWNTVGVRFHTPKKVESWAAVCLLPEAEAQASLFTFLYNLTGAMAVRGMDVAGADQPERVTVFGGVGREARTIEQLMRDAADRAARAFGKPAQIILVVLGDRVTEDKAEVKRMSDVEMGIPSQVLLAFKAGVGRGARPAGDQYCANVALKMNLKLGGFNTTLLGGGRLLPVLGIPPGSPAGTTLRPFMVLGADVTHSTGGGAGPSSRSAGGADSSVAAVVGSLDSWLGRWAARSMVQPRRQEMIEAMGPAITELLQEFYKANKILPERLVMYRDGVSEGQFEQVLSEEYMAMKRACQALRPGYNPLITVVVVQKRHNTRLLPAPGDRGADDGKGNVVPGTCVDKGITHPRGYDFWLNSHAGLQGTNKPAHYFTLVDEIGFGADAMQLFSYFLCYLFQRCTRSVSYATPAYYADRAAFHGQLLLTAMAASSGNESASDAGGGGGFIGAGGFVPVHKNLSNTLYFM